MTKRIACAAALAFLAACGEARRTSAGQQSGATGTTHTSAAGCAAAGLTGLTYATFAQGFFGTYCVRCHSVSKTGADRNGAPTDLNFDTLQGIQPSSGQIDQVAGMNPDGSVKNIFMPFTPPDPPDSDRQRLACWIAAGLPP